MSRAEVKSLIAQLFEERSKTLEQVDTRAQIQSKPDTLAEELAGELADMKHEMRLGSAASLGVLSAGEAAPLTSNNKDQARQMVSENNKDPDNLEETQVFLPGSVPSSHSVV